MGITNNLRLFFVYSGADSAPLVFCPDPNRDPNAEKSGRIIRTRKNDVVKNSEQKGAEIPRNARQKYPTNLLRRKRAHGIVYHAAGYKHSSGRKGVDYDAIALKAVTK